MNTKILKLAVLGTFFVFAGVVFFISTDRTGAQNARHGILEKVKEYKTWKQVTKPRDTAPGQQALFVISSVQIDTSTISG